MSGIMCLSLGDAMIEIVDIEQTKAHPNKKTAESHNSFHTLLQSICLWLRLAFGWRAGNLN